jgi:hypothetical protein
LEIEEHDSAGYPAATNSSGLPFHQPKNNHPIADDMTEDSLAEWQR